MPTLIGVNIEKFIVRLSVVACACLSILSSEVLAIGDSGGCSFDTEHARKMAFGSVAEIETFIGKRMSGYLEYLTRQNEAPFRKDPVALKEWQDNFRRKMLFDSMHCSHGEYPLDYAVSNGNLDVVRWLLDMGIDPNAFRGSIGGGKSIFSRCGLPGRISDRPDGLSKEQVRQRVIDSYRMLLARGADINDPNLFHSTYGCISTEMHPILKQLGARVSAKAFQSWTSYRDWAVVQELAKDEKFDFRGTEFEYRLLRNADISESDYKSIMALIQRLSSIVRLSPGIAPGQPAKPSDVPGGFSPVREQCYFPEISAYPNFDLLTLVRTSKADAPGATERDVTDIIVGKTKEPVILALHNDRDTPTKWVIHRAKDANVLGVIVINGRRGGNDVLSFDPSRPAFFGFYSACSLDYDSKIVDKRWVGLGGFRLMNPKGLNPATQTFNPFVLRGVPPIASFVDDQFSVGDVSLSQAWISWPDIARTKAKPLAEESGRERQGELFTEKNRQKSISDDQDRYQVRVAHITAANRYLAQGRLIDARAEYAAALKVPLAERHLQAPDERAKQVAEEGLKDIEARILRVDRSVETYTAKIRRGDDSAQTLVRRGLAYIENFDYGRGLEDLDRAKERLSGVEGVAVSRAWGYFRANEIGKAMSAARRILVEYPNNGDALSLLAWCSLLEGNADSANANALQAMEKKIHFTMGMNNRAYALIAAYFAERALRGAAGGEAVLKKYIDEVDGEPWPALALQYLAGAVSESKMLGEAERLRAKDSGNAYAEAVVFVAINSAFSSDWDTSRNRMHSLLNLRYRPTYPLAFRLIMNMSTKEPLQIVAGREGR